jgi:DNA-binding XRE family transcriptional regulator
VFVLKAQYKGRRTNMRISLRAARVNAGLTQDEVARQVNKSKNTIVSYEKGRSMPDIETGKALAKLYGMSVDDIIFLPNDCALSTICECEI